MSTWTDADKAAPGIGRRLMDFLPAVAVSLLALWSAHPALAWAPVVAAPLYLVAAARGGMIGRSLRAAAWVFWPLLGVLALLSSWPMARLFQGGDLLAVLWLGAMAGLTLVLAWRHAPWLALALGEPSDEPARERLLVLGRAAWTGKAGWLAALCLVLLAVAALYLAWAPHWLEPAVFRAALSAYALVLAPALALGAFAASYRQLADARHALIDGRPGAESTQGGGAQTYTPGPGMDAALYSAARAGRVDEALRLLEMGADPYALPSSGARDQRSLPVLAAVLPDLRLLRALIAAGVDLNRTDAGLAPLMAAVRDSYHGRPDAVLMLLANGADPRPADAEGQTALHAAARAADPSIAALLLDAGAPLDVLDAQGLSPLGVAAAVGNLDVAKYLLDRRAMCEPRGGEPALLAAAGREDDDPAMVKLLLRHKARIDAPGRLGRRALHAASLKANVHIVDALLAAGGSPDLPDDQGVTPLLEAARAGTAACVARLAANGADPMACDSHDRNALVIACQSNACDVDTVRALLALGVDPQQVAHDGRRAVDHAVAAGRWSLVAMLDPGYVLPACLTESDVELQDAPPLMRLRLALDRESFATARALLPLAIDSEESLAALYLDLAPRLGEAGARVLSDRLGPEATTPDGVSLVWQVLRLGPGAAPALRALLQRGAAPTGRGGLACHLNAALLKAELPTVAQDMALELLECGADPFAPDSDGTPPLLQAVRLGWHRLLDALLARGVDPELRDTQGNTALMLACQYDDEPAVRRLIVHGAQPGTRTSDGQSAHGLALALGRAHLAHWLDWPKWSLPRRALRDADLVAAARCGDSGAVQRLLELGISLEAVDGQGCTALLRACGGGHVELVRDLLGRGADAARPAHSGATCLSVALTARQIEVVWALVEHGVAVDQRLPGEITPLMIAAALGQGQAIVALLAYGADATTIDAHGGTALHALAQYGFGAREADVAAAAWESLLAAGAEVDAVNGVGETALLLLLGASFEPGTAYREEVLLSQLDVLLRYGAALNTRERRGFGPLHLAALHGMGRVVKRLLAAGADPDQRDALNRRAGEVALMRGYVDIASEFVSGEAAPSIARFLRERRD